MFLFITLFQKTFGKSQSYNWYRLELPIHSVLYVCFFFFNRFKKIRFLIIHGYFIWITLFLLFLPVTSCPVSYGSPLYPDRIAYNEYENLNYFSNTVLWNTMNICLVKGHRNFSFWGDHISISWCAPYHASLLIIHHCHGKAATLA